jgi:glycerophosphoryl diester phosphodiesterase
MRMFVFIILSFCMNATFSFPAHAQQVDIQGHRGARGLLPENTIPGFKKALNYGVTTLEMDLAVTADSMIVVSHEPYFSSAICKDSLGEAIGKKNEKKHSIYQMSYEDIQKYDCGSLGNPAFSEQEKIPVSKPLLKDVIKEVEWHIKSFTNYQVDYNIEIKTSPSGDGKYHPSPEEFSDLVYELIDQYLPWKRVIIQSFDFRILRYWHVKYPEVRLSVLIESPGPISSKLAVLGFQPAIYSPNFQLLNEQKVNYLHKQNIKVVPWTVNDPNQMEKLVKMGVDGIITDYPDRAAEIGLTLKIDHKNNNY